ncbi:MAG TPA: hypothetical protein ACN46P_09230 [Prochlorococcus sp.]
MQWFLVIGLDVICAKDTQAAPPQLGHFLMASETWLSGVIFCISSGSTPLLHVLIL